MHPGTFALSHQDSGIHPPYLSLSFYLLFIAYSFPLLLHLLFFHLAFFTHHFHITPFTSFIFTFWFLSHFSIEIFPHRGFPIHYHHLLLSDSRGELFLLGCCLPHRVPSAPCWGLSGWSGDFMAAPLLRGPSCKRVGKLGPLGRSFLSRVSLLVFVLTSKLHCIFYF